MKDQKTQSALSWLADFNKGIDRQIETIQRNAEQTRKIVPNLPDLSYTNIYIADPKRNSGYWYHGSATVEVESFEAAILLIKRLNRSMSSAKPTPLAVVGDFSGSVRPRANLQELRPTDKVLDAEFICWEAEITVGEHRQNLEVALEIPNYETKTATPWYIALNVQYPVIRKFAPFINRRPSGPRASGNAIPTPAWTLSYANLPNGIDAIQYNTGSDESARAKGWWPKGHPAFTALMADA